WPLKLLRFFVKKEYLEEIEGDMEEVFRDNTERFSPAKARRMYTWEMIRLLRPVLLKNLSALHYNNPYPMFKNYFKTSLRSLLKNPLTSFINVFGLSVAIGITLLVYVCLKNDHNIDQFHEHKHTVFLTTFFADRDGEVQQYGLTPRPLGEMLKADFTHVKKVCRIEDGNVVMKRDEHVFHERVRYADPEFLSMFTFPLKWGSAGSLADLNSIILSEDMSIKYFGDENPVGRDMLMVFNDSTRKAFTVAGVAATFPTEHIIDFNFLINFENLRVANPGYDVNDWRAFVNATLIQVDNPADIRTIEQGMEKYKSLQNQVEKDWAIASFAFEPLSELHFRSADIRNDISADDNAEVRIGMPVIALFMLALACFNYINMAIVSAAKRLKEIGVRKVIGANRLRVIVQFLTENIFITFFALIVGCILGITIFIPWFIRFSGWDLNIDLMDRNLWIFLTGLLLFTGLASGIYPAFYISKFETVRIFKGAVEFGRKNPLTKVFLGIQLVLACITITAAVVFTQNGKYQNNLSWGYNQNNVLYVYVQDQTAFDKMNAAFVQDPNVISRAGSADHMGKTVSNAILHTPSNQHYEVNRIAVDAQYLETMELELLQGRSFKAHAETDKQTILVNELLVKNLNLTEPVGYVFEIDSMRYEVIGVVKDFHTQDFFSEVQPTIFTVADEEDYHYLSMRVKEGTAAETFQAVQRQWAKLYPEIPFQGGHQEDVWTSYFVSVDRSEKFNKVIATIAVLLAALGLYGLVTLNVSGRKREFSIRKTLGAGMQHISSVIMKQYVLLTLAAIIIGAPVSYVFTKAYLAMLFAYPMPMDYSGTILSVIILVLVLVTVISTQIRKVLKSNPVDGLKVE
ncbi:MAG TPA: FtsX-like permease family protein, partial [Ohtaekwangia sp.]